MIDELALCLYLSSLSLDESSYFRHAGQEKVEILRLHGKND